MIRTKTTRILLCLALLLAALPVQPVSAQVVHAPSATLPMLTISGHTLPGTTFTASTLPSTIATADAAGDYSFQVENGWYGEVYPSLPGYKFTPTSRAYANLTQDQPAQDYTAIRNRFFITGNIGLPYASIETTYVNIVSDANGNYSLSVPPGWSGTITPKKPYLQFNPLSREYTNVNQDLAGQDFTYSQVYITISGYIEDPSATLSIYDYETGITSTTPVDPVTGKYSFQEPAGWLGIVTPSLDISKATSFRPPYTLYNLVQTNQPDNNYIVAPVKKLTDGGFENRSWYETSSNFGFVTCTIPTCSNGRGTAGPRSGLGWAWFGGTPLFEVASATTYVGLPTGHPNLKLLFYLWIGEAGQGSDIYDTFEAQLAGKTIFKTNATEIKKYSSYTPVVIDISDLENVENQLLTFESHTMGQLVNFNLDDVSLIDVVFKDVLPDHWAKDWIETLSRNGITGGCAPMTYCPAWTVTRDQMAVFLLRAVHGRSYTPPPATGIFSDVPASHWAATWIEQLAAEGITGGCAPGKYCPDWAVTRDQMAVFLLRAVHGSDYTPPAATGKFSDVPVTHWAAAWIEQLSAEGITGGCAPGKYCPSSPVTRDQMAVFLVRAFGLK